MALSLPSIWTSDIAEMSQNVYEKFLEEGYVETQSLTRIYKGTQGKCVLLEKPISPLCRVIRMVSCVVMAPFSCILTGITCCCCADETMGCCFNHLYDPAKKGAYVESGFLADRKATLELRNADFQSLGCVAFDQENIVLLAQSNRYPIIQSISYPQHSYMPFYGPETGLSYIIVIPFGQCEESVFFVVSNSKKQPCSSKEMIEQGEKLCGNYKPPKKIGQTATKALRGSPKGYGSFPDPSK